MQILPIESVCPVILIETCSQQLSFYNGLSTSVRVAIVEWLDCINGETAIYILCVHVLSIYMMDVLALTIDSSLTLKIG